MSRVRHLIVLIAALGAAASAQARSGSPPANRAGVCGSTDTNLRCTGCHQPTGSSVLQMGLLLAGTPPTPLPSTYTPGQTYRLLLSAAEAATTGRCDPDPGPCDLQGGDCGLGFEITAVRESSCGPSVQAGGCFPTPQPQTGVRVRCLTGFDCGCNTELQFAQHNCVIRPSPVPGNPGVVGKTWELEWQAPAAGAGRVGFYWVVNSVNGDGSTDGDDPAFGSAGMDEGTTAQSCDLRRERSATLGPPIDKLALFNDSTSCAPYRLPMTDLVAGFSLTPDQQVDPLDDGNPLAVYQVECACPGTLYMTKSAGQVRAIFQ